MTTSTNVIFTHAVPADLLSSTVPINTAVGAFIVDDPSWSIYLQESSGTPPVLVGAVPCSSDGLSGITQLARDLDIRNYSQRVPANTFTANISSNNLVVNYPNVPVFWDGVIQTLVAGSITAPTSTGTWSLVVSYNWGLTQVALVQSSTIVPEDAPIELCQINVNTTNGTAVVQLGRLNSKWLTDETVAGTINSATGIPVSGASGTMTW